jgi:SAM-dependent methyltransferase
MSAAQEKPERADYGIDAPHVVRNLALLGAAGLVLALVALFALEPVQPALAAILFNMGLWPGITLLLTAGIMVWGSKVGKLRLRDRLLDGIPWRGDEQVLDVGCGRGLLLVGAARRLRTGKAIGVDLWQKEDLSGNRPEAVQANARAEGVADRVEVKDGDARALPFPDAGFDVVLSSTALHNIYETAERHKALREIARVLKPGGRVAVFDIRHTDEYARVFRECGLDDVRRSRPYFIFVIPAHTVTARKPDSEG